MGRVNFYVLWSLRDAPRQFISKSNRSVFHVHIPLPLPNLLVIFGVGEWSCSDAEINVDVVVGADVPAQRIGILTATRRCLTWEGDWSPDVVLAAAQRGRRGVYGKIVLTVCSEDEAAVFSSRKSLFPEQHEASELFHNETVTPDSSRLGDSVFYADVQVNKIDTSDASVGEKPPVWPTDQTPRRTVIGRRGRLTWSSDDVDVLSDDRASTPKRTSLSRINSREKMTVQIRNDNREVSVCPSKRWSHAMCLIDPDTAVLVGGEAAEPDDCRDSLWKLELDNDFWFPVNSSTSGPAPPCARGHSATYDPDSRSVFVYGGLRESQRYSEVYILNTLTWKWRLVTAKGNVPDLAYHSAAFYRNELFVFGGVQPSVSSVEKSCSNALYIFNPEFELWYQPIVEGQRPLPRFGHSATMMSQKLLIFGGRKTASYLNDLHVLDLGLMEYTAVKSGNLPPLPRGFHAAVRVSDDRILVSGGCSAIGALQDVHIFNTDSGLWSSVSCPPLCARPRAGHSVLVVSGRTDAENHERRENVGGRCTVLVFGGSDCTGNFYNDAFKCTLEIPGDQGV